MNSIENVIITTVETNIKENVIPDIENLHDHLETMLDGKLGRLAKEDPSFRVTSDEESGQTIIKGMGELHLDIIVDRMKREFKVEANVGAPQVAYRETILNAAEFDYTHKKQSGGVFQNKF